MVVTNAQQITTNIYIFSIYTNYLNVFLSFSVYYGTFYFILFFYIVLYSY